MLCWLTGPHHTGSRGWRTSQICDSNVRGGGGEVRGCDKSQRRANKGNCSLPKSAYGPPTEQVPLACRPWPSPTRHLARCTVYTRALEHSSTEAHTGPANDRECRGAPTHSHPPPHVRATAPWKPASVPTCSVTECKLYRLSTGIACDRTRRVKSDSLASDILNSCETCVLSLLFVGDRGEPRRILLLQPAARDVMNHNGLVPDRGDTGGRIGGGAA